MTEFLIAAGFAICAVAFFFLGRAARPTPASEQDARKTFEGVPDFHPGEVHANQGSAISYDPVRNRITIWDKSGGVRLLDPDGVASWQVHPDIRFFAKTADRKPFFSVAIVSESERAQWRDRLQAVLGGEKEMKAGASA